MEYIMDNLPRLTIGSSLTKCNSHDTVVVVRRCQRPVCHSTTRSVQHLTSPIGLTVQ